jgi:hypothetical protein
MKPNVRTYKQSFRRLNLTVHPQNLRRDEYTYLKNAVPVQAPGGEDLTIATVLGNTLLTNADLAAGTNTVIGELVDEPGRRCFFFVHNSNSDHTIYVINHDLTIQRVLRTSLFGLTLTGFLDATIEGDILVWTIGTEETMKINVAKALAGGTYTPTKEQITLIKRPPYRVLTGVTFNDLAFTQNYIQGHYFQFYYRYVYEDSDVSVWSHLSDTIRADWDDTSHNSISVTIPATESIPVTVKQIDYAVRIDAANEFFVYRSDFPVAGVLGSLTHVFYNNIFLYTVPDTEQLKWSDAVPRFSKSLTIFRNRLWLFNNTEGYSYKATPISGMTFSLATGTGFGRTYKCRGAYSFGLMFFDFTGRHAGVHISSTSHLVMPDRTNGATVTRNRVNWDLTGVAQADIPTWATHYAIVRTKCKNISFFLQHKAMDVWGVRRNPDGSLDPLYSPAPPYKVWTKPHGLGEAHDPNREHAFIDIGSLTRLNMGYTFNKGDRIRVYLKDGTGYQGPSVDLDIKGQEGQWVYTKYFQAAYGYNSDAEAKPVVFDIYRPKTDSQELFFEVGQKFAITNPGTGLRAFGTLSGGMDGDCEVNGRETFSYVSDLTPPDPYNHENPYVNIVKSLGTTDSFEMMNVSDLYFDKWAAEPAGRSMAFSRIGSLEFLRTNHLRYGQPFVKGSGVSLLNTFEDMDDYPLPAENGPGTRIVRSHNVLVAICQNRTSSLYIGEGFVNTRSGTDFLAKTDNVIGDDRNYLQGYGSIHPHTVAVDEDGRVYFYDMTRGAIVRRSQDGLTNVSDDYDIGPFIRDFSRSNFATPDTVKFRGGIDPQYKLYVFTAVGNWTLGFHEAHSEETKPYWVGFFDYEPDVYSRHRSYLLSFKAGGAWIHNNATLMNFYGMQKTRALEFTIPLLGTHVNLIEGISIDSDDFWTDVANDEVVRISNNGAGVIRSGPGTQLTRINYLDLKNLQGVYQSAIFRDVNTPQPFDAGKAKYEGEKMRGQIFKFTIYANKTNDAARLRSITVLYTPSPRSYV